ncbi:hypothetical protein AB0L63_20825 [Nocardia sp. NPDC051990]|uniref:hypothetical protein n=1 Tax=Nocardia sp. NPDC051990 TaxID=3155285 RepID=UPI003448AEC6
MNEVERQRGTDLAPSVAALLKVFHEHTSEKLNLAPVDSVMLCHTSDGITEVDEDGWLADYDDDRSNDARDVLPVSAVDRENP